MGCVLTSRCEIRHGGLSGLSTQEHPCNDAARHDMPIATTGDCDELLDRLTTVDRPNSQPATTHSNAEATTDHRNTRSEATDDDN